MLAWGDGERVEMELRMVMKGFMSYKERPFFMFPCANWILVLTTSRYPAKGKVGFKEFR